jgi:hypothetical protein
MDGARRKAKLLRVRDDVKLKYAENGHDPAQKEDHDVLLHRDERGDSIPNIIDGNVK